MSYKRIPSAPLTGPLDFRTAMEQMTNDRFRFRENFSNVEAGRLCRLPGWERFLSRTTGYANPDLHDQLLPLQTILGEREAITFGMQFRSQAGSRKLLAGTQSRLYSYNPTLRNWKILCDGKGGPADASLGIRWKGDYLKDVAVFTNNYDVPVYWEYGGDAAIPIPDLDLIGLTAAAVVVQFGNRILLMNVVLNGRRFANQIVFTDPNNAIGFDPASAGSSAGFTTLPFSDGETILAAARLEDSIIVYTDRGIYIGDSTGDADNPLDFRKHYTPDESLNRCLQYPNTLISDGKTHLYMGLKSIYSFTPYRREPEEKEWLYQAAGAIYDGNVEGYARINGACCQSPIAGYDPVTNNIWFSWPEGDSCIPSKSMVVNLDNEFASTVDFGWTMFVAYHLDERISFRDWLLQTCSCNLDALSALGINFDKEPQPMIELCVGFTPTCIWTNTPGTFYGIETEDWDKPESDADSLCAKLDGKFLEEYCRGCNDSRYFIGASSNDWCLKQIGTAFSREVCTNPTDEGTLDDGKYYCFEGEYEYQGYNSTIRSVGNAYGSFQMKKNIKRLFLEAVATAQVDPCVVSVRVGYSYNARDPNQSNCGVIWSDPVRVYLQCPDDKTSAEYKADNEVPNDALEFPFYQSGTYLYWEMTIASLSNQEDLDSSLIPGIGGDACFGLMMASIRSGESVVKT